MKGNECGYNKRFCSHIGNQIFDWSIFSIVHVRPMVKMKKGFLSIFWTGGRCCLFDSKNGVHLYLPVDHQVQRETNKSLQIVYPP
jgi:hypothetical protein